MCKMTYAIYIYLIYHNLITFASFGPSGAYLQVDQIFISAY